MRASCSAVKFYTFQLTAQIGFVKEGGDLESGKNDPGQT